MEWAWSPTALIASHNNNNRKWREYNLQSYSWQIKSLGHLRDYYLNYFFLCQGHTKHGYVHLWSNPRAINWLFFIAPSPLLLNQLSGVRWWCPPHYPLDQLALDLHMWVSDIPNCINVLLVLRRWNDTSVTCHQLAKEGEVQQKEHLFLSLLLLREALGCQGHMPFPFYDTLLTIKSFDTVTQHWPFMTMNHCFSL